MALINLSYMTEFFTKLSPVMLRKPTFCFGSRFLKNVIEEVLVLNNKFVLGMSIPKSGFESESEMIWNLFLVLPIRNRKHLAMHSLRS